MAALYGESPTLVTQKRGGVGSDDETFNNALLIGHPFISLDNRREKFDSAHLEAFVTESGSFPARIPHHGTIQIDPTVFIVALTSNGVETTPDLANRSSIIRIRKRKGVAFRRYPAGDLLDHVRTAQPFYLGCIFAVVREWLASGRARTEETRHDFRPWAQTLDWILQNILREPPLMDEHSIAQARVSNPAMTFVRNIGVLLAQLDKLNSPLMAAELAELALDNGIAIPHLRDGDGVAGAKLVGSAMAKILGSSDEMAVEGIVVRRNYRDSKRADDKGYASVKVYTFTQAVTAAVPGPGVPPGNPINSS